MKRGVKRQGFPHDLGGHNVALGPVPAHGVGIDGHLDEENGAIRRSGPSFQERRIERLGISVLSTVDQVVGAQIEPLDRLDHRLWIAIDVERIPRKIPMSACGGSQAGCLEPGRGAYLQLRAVEQLKWSVSRLEDAGWKLPLAGSILGGDFLLKVEFQFKARFAYPDNALRDRVAIG